MPAQPYKATIFDDSGNHKGVDQKDSKSLQAGAKEVYATGKNELKRDTNKTMAHPKLGVKGFPN